MGPRVDNLLQKFVEYLTHNPYWGVLHESAENKTFGPVDAETFNGRPLTELEKEIVDVWNSLPPYKRKELARIAEETVEGS